MSIGYCFTAEVDLYFIGENDTKKYMGYEYIVKKTSDDYCISSTRPEDGRVWPGGKARFRINYKNGVFSYCGWRHSSQYFHIEKIDDPNISAGVRWYKPAGQNPYIKIVSDPHHIVHLERHWWDVNIGYLR